MDQVEEVKSKVDLVEVISSYLPLKKMGRNMGGLCPFHAEKTASFMISPERQVWKCFGCSLGGDVFTFLEKIEGWDFREALEELAKRVGVKLKQFEPTDKSRVRDKLIEINKLTTKFYSHLLFNHPAGERARKYLAGRGIKKETWEKFKLGYSPDSWDTLFKFLIKHKIPTADVAMSGLAIARSGSDRSFYDRFRDRLIFPISDSRGQVMGFSGRVLDANAREAKYVNTSETPLFVKGSLLFGLDIARSAIRDSNEAVLVEGEFDVLSAHQAGVENVIASKGTALTERQVAMLSRLSESVVLCFDKDVAGDNAARRGIELLDMAGVSVKVADLGGAKDPDEFAQDNPKGFTAAIASASNIYDFLIDSAVKRFDPKEADGQKKIGREILPVL
ncbi:DNA primase [Candidatus Curtissbacteria bacterium]|nr:DNA primase [Candidatus Curtissbacteria bacterium]